MSSLFDKINTLVNAQVNELMGRYPRSPLSRIKLNADDAEKNPRRSAQALRERLEEAMDYEEVLQQKIDVLMQEALHLDQQIDTLVSSGDDIRARHVQGQLNMKQQQLTIAEAELRDHRLLSRHLMQELRSLEAALDGQPQNTQTAAGAPAKKRSGLRIPVDGASRNSQLADDQKPTFIGAVTDKLDEARAGLENLLNQSPVPQPPELANRYDEFDLVDEVPDPRSPKPERPSKPDMNSRLSRLRNPAEDDD